MPFEMKVLLVEDQQSNIDLWRDLITAHNVQPERIFSINLETAKSVNDANQLIRDRQFDAAIVDLRLGQQHPPAGHNADGNSVVRLLSETALAAVAVFTGAPQEADFEEDLPQVRVFPRDEGQQQVIQWMGEQVPLLAAITTVKRSFNESMARLFHKSIWPRWSDWVAPGNANVDDSLARHLSAHLHEEMLTKGNGIVHPEECYFVPPISTQLETGNLVEIANQVWIVVTPRCDLARRNYEQVQLAWCFDISAEWNRLKASGSNAANQDLAKMKQHKQSPKIHFIPQMRDGNRVLRGPWFVKFDTVKSTPANEISPEFLAGRFASLTPQFLPSLVERLGTYFSRIGTPDFP